MDSVVNLSNLPRNCPVTIVNMANSSSDDVSVCRGCLAFDAKLYNLFDTGLAGDFEELVRTGAYQFDSLPQFICIYCAGLLLKASAFRKRCRAAHTALEGLLASQDPLTRQSITTIDRTEIKQNLIKTQTQTLSYIPKNQNTINDDSITIISDSNHVRPKRKRKSDVTEDVKTDVKDKLTLEGFESDTELMPDVKEVFVDTSNTVNSDITIKNEDNDIESDDFRLIIDSDYDSDTKLNLLIKKEDTKKTKTKSKVTKTRKVVKKKKNIPIKKEKEIQNKEKKSKRKKDEYPDEIKEIYRLPKKNRLEQFSKEYEVDIVMLNKDQQIAELEEKKNSDKYNNASLKCDKCYKGFAMEKSFKQHMARHDVSRGEFECEICGFRFKNRRRVLAHAREYHVFNYTCKICKKTYKNPHWARFHYKMHQGEKPTCKQCGEQFAHPSVLQLHVRKEHGSARCPICNIVCAKAASVQQHIALVHKVQQVCCEKCDVRFESQEALSRHLEESTDKTCSKDKKPCGTCGDSFSTEESFEKHKQFCTPPPPPKKDYKCQQCFRPFASAQSLRNHMNYYHKRDPVTNKCMEPGMKKRGRKKGSKVDKTAPPKTNYGYPTLMCEICGKNNFKFKSALRVHQSTHSRERPFKCDVCDKSFKLQMHLKLHMAVHTGEKRYECTVCAKKFRQHAHLAQHMVLHTNEMPFSCELCGKRFRFQGSHWQHMRAHEGIHRARANPRSKYSYNIAEDTFDSL